MPAQLVLEVHALNVTTGHWCATCALPSGIKATIVVVDGRTLRIVQRMPTFRCTECNVEIPLANDAGLESI